MEWDIDKSTWAVMRAALEMHPYLYNNESTSAVWIYINKFLKLKINYSTYFFFYFWSVVHIKYKFGDSWLLERAANRTLVHK